MSQASEKASRTVGSTPLLIALALLYAAALVYGSLVADTFQSVSIDEALATLLSIPENISFNRLDVAINLALYMPLGFFWQLVGIRFRGNQFLQFIFVLAACVTLSFTLELSQAWMVAREPSLLDLAANSLGAVVGMFGALIAQTLYLHFLGRSQDTQQRRQSALLQLEVLLAVFCLCYLCAAFANILLTLLRRSSLTLANQSEGALLVWSRYDAIGLDFFGSGIYHLLMFFFCGVLTMLVGQKHRALMPVLLLVCVLSLLCAELLEAHFKSQAFEVLDIALGGVGFLIGAGLAYFAPKATRSSFSLWLLEHPVVVRVACAGYYIGLLFFSCYPFRFSTARFHYAFSELSLIPFRSLQLKSYDDAFEQIASQFMLGVPLGFLVFCCVILAQRRLSWKIAYYRSVGITALSFGIVETVQLAEATRVGSLDSVIICTFGAFAGQLLAHRWLQHSIERSYSSQ